MLPPSFDLRLNCFIKQTNVHLAIKINEITHSLQAQNEDCSFISSPGPFRPLQQSTCYKKHTHDHLQENDSFQLF